MTTTERIMTQPKFSSGMARAPKTALDLQFYTDVMVRYMETIGQPAPRAEVKTAICNIFGIQEVNLGK